MQDRRSHPHLDLTPELKRLLGQALKEDVGSGDVTTQCTVPLKLEGRGELIAKAPGVLCGAPVANEIWRQADKRTHIHWRAHDGAEVAPGDLLAELSGPMRGLLIGERVALNFLQRLSGIATLTHKFYQAVGPEGPVICDTRKTTPLWRVLERYAVRIGGGTNHRFGLFDMILIKENHARAAGGLREAIRAAKELVRVQRGGKREHKGHALRIAAEARDLFETQICCDEKVDLVLLDNFTPAQARKAVDKFKQCRIPFEISGGVTLKNIAAFAAARPDRISIGALTHSAPALDISLQLYQS